MACCLLLVSLMLTISLFLLGCVMLKMQGFVAVHFQDLSDVFHLLGPILLLWYQPFCSILDSNKNMWCSDRFLTEWWFDLLRIGICLSVFHPGSIFPLSLKPPLWRHISGQGCHIKRQHFRPWWNFQLFSFLYKLCTVLAVNKYFVILST